ncbi:uncharacterized protein V1516DRAFT_669683 [Lipomyces oligophaga]|uniref:uncharacterized protein n=1 Tax=Lipomyces oligophaga TaxID=45792 RepID=UPI0034CEBF86
MNLSLRAVAAVFLWTAVVAAWSFSEGSIAITQKSSTLETRSFSIDDVNTEPLVLPQTAAIRLRFLVNSESEETVAKPHQVYAILYDPASGLETAFPADVRDGGRSRLEIDYKLIPSALLGPSKPLVLKLVVASFGDEKPLLVEIATVIPQYPEESVSSPSRFGAKPEIIHQFKPDPTFAPRSITLLVSAAIASLIILLFGLWSFIGVSPLSLSSFSSLQFLAVIVIIELIFVKYYIGSTIFSLIGQASVLAPLAFFSGRNALRDLQTRRLAGKW